MPSSPRSEPVRRRRIIAVAILLAMAVTFPACDDDTSPSEQDAVPEGPSLQLVVPAHEATPAVELTFQMTSVDGEDIEALREPVGNVIYLAIRDCSEAHPEADSDEIRAAALNFRIHGGEVTDVEAREAALRQERAVSVSEEGSRCLLEEVADQSVELDEQWRDVEFEVASQAELSW